MFFETKNQSPRRPNFSKSVSKSQFSTAPTSQKDSLKLAELNIHELRTTHNQSKIEKLRDGSTRKTSIGRIFKDETMRKG